RAGGEPPRQGAGAPVAVSEPLGRRRPHEGPARCLRRGDPPKLPGVSGPVSTETAKKTRALSDYLSLFEMLAAEGIETVVIGGCAVGAYARQMGQEILSGDLDLYATDRNL